jgi:hypothetical protein
MIRNVENFNKEINGMLEELDENVKEFNDKSAELLGE